MRPNPNQEVILRVLSQNPEGLMAEEIAKACSMGSVHVMAWQNPALISLMVTKHVARTFMNGGVRYVLTDKGMLEAAKVRGEIMTEEDKAQLDADKRAICTQIMACNTGAELKERLRMLACPMATHEMKAMIGEGRYRMVVPDPSDSTKGLLIEQCGGGEYPVFVQLRDGRKILQVIIKMSPKTEQHHG